MADNSESWHLDKRVNVSVILTLLGHLAVSLWWASSINERVTVAETRIERLANVSEMQRNASAAQAVQLGRIEEQITGLRSDILRLLDTIERGRE